MEASTTQHAIESETIQDSSDDGTAALASTEAAQAINAHIDVRMLEIFICQNCKIYYF